ncbi:MAG: hypothetical protein RLY35_57 [Bacteroidota bacterium]|jgi:hypothetical protein
MFERDMKKYILSIAIGAALLFSQCQKEAGDGGLASISGVINKEVRVVLSNPASAMEESFPAVDQEVYIVYGDHTSPDDKVVTNYEGKFEFKGLRKGDYTIYTYSLDTAGTAAAAQSPMAVKVNVKITERTQEKTIDPMVIYDEKQ